MAISDLYIRVNYRWQEEELEGLAAWLDANEGSPFGYGPVQTSEYPPRSAYAVVQIVNNIAKLQNPTGSKAEIKRLYLKHKARGNEVPLADRGIYDPRDGDDDDYKARGLITQGAIDHLTKKLNEGVKRNHLWRYVPQIRRMVIQDFIKNRLKRSAKQHNKNKTRRGLQPLCTEELCRILNNRAKVRDIKITEIRRKHKLIEKSD